MTFSKEAQEARQRGLMLAGLILLFPVFYLLARLTQQSAWLALAVLPPVLGLLWFSAWIEGVLIFLTSSFFSFFFLRSQEPILRLEIIFNFFVLGLLLSVAAFFMIKKKEEDALHQEVLSSLEERLTMARENYKTGLAVNVTNQKKFQRYYLLNRLSRIFGSKLQVQTLADSVVREMREIIGSERGRYALAFYRPDKDEFILRCAPEAEACQEIVDDQYGLWATQHRTTLLVTDTTSDFRFHPQGTDSPVRALMAAPLLAEGRVIGMLRAGSPWPGMFTTDDLRLFTIIADLAGIALENARLYQRAQELAITDGLTGLYLRRFFNRRLEEEIGRFREHGISFTLVIVDLDHFKRINDRWGHLAGDQVLAQVAELLRSGARIPDILCRFGGEEFALILPNTRLEGGLIMAERIRQHIAEYRFIAGEHTLNMTISAGLAECPQSGTTLDALVKAADEALYAAKRQGRNRVIRAGDGV